MKNILRASLVVLSLAGVYAGLTAPASAQPQQHTITVADGGAPIPTSPTSPTKPGSGGTQNN